jgi:hypothetical protein
MKDFFAKFWPTIAAVLVECADLIFKKFDTWASGHEHTVVGVLLAAIVALWQIIPFPRKEPKSNAN